MAELVGRGAECEALDRSWLTARGSSRVLVVRGVAGVGKSACSATCRAGSDGWQRRHGPAWSRRWSWPTAACTSSARRCWTTSSGCRVPQRDALATVFGLSAGRRARPLPGRPGHADAVRRGRRAAAAGLHRRRRAVARPRLRADPRVRRPPPAGRADRARVRRATGHRRRRAGRAARAAVDGLDDGDARALLLGNMHGPLDAAIIDQIVAESHGNPLALLELPRTWTAAISPAGSGCPAASRSPARSSRATPQRLAAAPPTPGCSSSPRPPSHSATRCCSTGPLTSLGIDMAAAAPAVDAGLLEVGARVEFAHPLVRSAAYRSATADDRHRVHRALAEATDADDRPGPARLAPGPRHRRTRRGSGGGAGAFGRPGPGSRRARRRGRVPDPGHRADTGPGCADAGVPWPPPSPTSRPARSTPLGAARDRRRRADRRAANGPRST